VTWERHWNTNRCGFVDTKDTKDRFYARPAEAVPLVDDPGAV